MMKITNEVFQVGGDAFTRPEDAAVYLLCFDGRAALVDAGCGETVDALCRNIADCGVSERAIKYLLITHCHFDHTGGAAALRDRIGCRVVAHSADADCLEEGNDVMSAATLYGTTLTPVTVDIRLTGDRESVFLGDRPVTAIHIPGHSPGSVAYLIESEGLRVLFAQDVHGPLDPSLLSDRAAYRRSLALIRDLDVDILCEGHYGVYRGRDEVRSFIASYL